MTSAEDPTKALLEKLVADLYGAASSNPSTQQKGRAGSFLEGDDKQFLGKITDNAYDTDSIINQYGPYGSPYSQTSIFNSYCPYGGPYGRFSPENPYTTTPPRLIIEGREIGKVSANSYVKDRIPVEAFLHSIRNNIRSLMRGDVSRNDISALAVSGGTYIQAHDGTFLGNLSPNQYDTNSVFNRYGEYGNKYSSLSIFNNYSQYGGRYSAFSPYNPLSSTPPMILSGTTLVAYLTVNTTFAPRVDPADIFTWAQGNVKKRNI